jgi:hypothetical protein
MSRAYRPSTRVVSSPHFVGRWGRDTGAGMDGWSFYRISDNAFCGWTGGTIADARAHLDECERQYTQPVASAEHDHLCFCVDCLSRANTPKPEVRR